MPFHPAVTPPVEQGGAVHWFVFSDERILVRMGETSARVPLVEKLDMLGIGAVRSQYLGHFDEIACYSAEATPESTPSPGWTFQSLRRLFGLMDEPMFDIAVRAKQIVLWDRTHQYCGQCGAITQDMKAERAKLCPKCGLMSYPRLSPAVIVAVTRGDEILLARAQRFPQGFYSVLAGYVEPGETLEECVTREIREEVGISVRNIRYFGSQSWPFPHSLMIAFTAEHASGDIRPDPSEIADAGWFHRGDLPWIPEKISIARRLIDWYVSSGNSSPSSAPDTLSQWAPMP